MNTAVWIIIAVVVVLLLIGLAFALSRKQKAKRRVEAGQIREEASHRVNDVQRREAIAEESAAKARRAQADAEAKAAEAKRLQHEAQSHHGVAASSREELDAEFQRADKIDPDVPRNGRHDGDRQDADRQNVGPQNAEPQRGQNAAQPVQNVGNHGPNGGQHVPGQQAPGNQGPVNQGQGVRLDNNGQLPRQDEQQGRHTPPQPR